MFFIDERQTNRSGENSEKISKLTKSLLDELQVKTKTAAAKTMNSAMNSAMNEQNHEE